MENETFGRRLARLREKTGLSQDRLAKILNVAPSRLGMYEINQREPDFEMLIVLSDYFNVTIDYLVRGRKQEGSA